MKQLLTHLLLGSLLMDVHQVASAADLPVSNANPSNLSNITAANPSAAGIIRFDIERFEVVGNTLLSPALVEKTVAPFAGKSRDFGDVQKALEALEAAFRARGFSVVQVELPEQELNGGVVRLRVVETRIGKVLIEGNRQFSDANIQRSLPGLREGQSPNIKNVSASLKVGNENPAKKVGLQLESADKDGEVNAVLKVTEDNIFKYSASLDNTGTRQTGKTRLGLSFQDANLFGLDHVASFQYTTTLENPSQISVYGLGYHIPLYASGDSLDFFGSFSDVDSGSISAGTVNLQVSGKGKVYGVRYNQNLERSPTYEPKLNYGLDYKAFVNGVVVSGSGLNLGKDVTVHPVSVTYSGTFTLQQAEAGFSLSYAHNIPGGKDGESQAFGGTRLGATSTYSILRYSANYSRLFGRDWQLRLGASGQYTADALIPGEQFGAGGSTSVRGFTEREVANDYGTQVNAEVYTPNLCSEIKFFATQCRVLVFYDAARLERNKALPGEIRLNNISSTGLGFRMNVDKYLNMQVDYGHVLSGVNGSEKNRLHFKMNFSY